MLWNLLRLMRRVLTEPILLGLVVLLACERSTPAAARKDTAVPIVPPPETTTVVEPEAAAWDSTAGPALFVVGPTPTEALVIMPDYGHSAPLDSARFDVALLHATVVDLFAHGKRVGRARIRSPTTSARTDSCRAWPGARLDVSPSDTAAIRDWTVAFQADRAAELVLDSIAGLVAADSARLAADIARLASALPGDTSATFRGLPFVVNKAWRTRGPGGQVFLAAIVVRNVNQEANPRQERILLIAERDSSTSAGRYVPQYSERVSGLEETVEATDLVAMVLLGAERRPTLVITRDVGNESSYALIERVSGRWQRRWASVYAGC